jgi:hypothetical protein
MIEFVVFRDFKLEVIICVFPVLLPVIIKFKGMDFTT